MRLMEEKILREGKVLPGGVLKVGSFLNQQIDSGFLRSVGEEIARLYEGSCANKILTIESSGIAIAAAAGIAMGIPVLFAKKHRSSNVDGEVYSAAVHSFTKNTDYNIVVSRDYLSSGDRVVMVDDFLASGNAFFGLLELCRQAGAEVVGFTAAIEKGFQHGGDRLRQLGYRVESLAIVDGMGGSEITFRR